MLEDHGEGRREPLQVIQCGLGAVLNAAGQDAPRNQALQGCDVTGLDGCPLGPLSGRESERRQPVGRGETESHAASQTPADPEKGVCGLVIVGKCPAPRHHGGVGRADDSGGFGRIQCSLDAVELLGLGVQVLPARKARGLDQASRLSVLVQAERQDRVARPEATRGQQPALRGRRADGVVSDGRQCPAQGGEQSRARLAAIATIERNPVLGQESSRRPRRQTGAQTARGARVKEPKATRGSPPAGGIVGDHHPEGGPVRIGSPAADGGQSGRYRADRQAEESAQNASRAQVTSGRDVVGEDQVIGAFGCLDSAHALGRREGSHRGERCLLQSIVRGLDDQVDHAQLPGEMGEKGRLARADDQGADLGSERKQ